MISLTSYRQPLLPDTIPAADKRKLHKDAMDFTGTKSFMPGLIFSVDVSVSGSKRNAMKIFYERIVSNNV